VRDSAFTGVAAPCIRPIAKTHYSSGFAAAESVLLQFNDIGTVNSFDEDSGEMALLGGGIVAGSLP
jgi:hypothetical protein